jgi:hypothetical protein
MDGVQLINHNDKSQAMTDYYSIIHGVADETRWNFDVAALYNKSATHDLDDLLASFTEAEALQAVKSMNINSAPGPDGVGPAWYATVGASIKSDIQPFLSSFHRGEVDLNRINWAHIMLLPKCEGATAPKDFRPVSLQNCPVKIITKILTTRL